MRWPFVVLPLALAACSGRTSGGPDGGAEGDSGAVADAGGGDSPSSEAGGECGAPSQVEYTCPHAFPDGGICSRYGGPGDVSPADAGFASGCMVTLTSCNPYYGVPQTCNCEGVPIGDGGAGWVCPL